MLEVLWDFGWDSLLSHSMTQGLILSSLLENGLDANECLQNMIGKFLVNLEL